MFYAQDGTPHTQNLQATHLQGCVQVIYLTGYIADCRRQSTEHH